MVNKHLPCKLAATRKQLSFVATTCLHMTEHLYSRNKYLDEWNVLSTTLSPNMANTGYGFFPLEFLAQNQIISDPSGRN